ncbi:MAG: flavin reductase family protein [bacterium]|nr:flavin reductase family protein [bacterium]
MDESKLDNRALMMLTYGLYVITSHYGDKLNGLICDAAMQVARNPARLAISINKTGLTHDYIVQSGEFALSILEESTPMTFIGLFGFRSGRDIDKLSQVAFKKGVSGCPLVTEHCLAVLEATVCQQVDVGSHTLFIGEVISSEVLKEGTPMTYIYYRQQLKGKTPSNSPTYSGEK